MKVQQRSRHALTLGIDRSPAIAFVAVAASLLFSAPSAQASIGWDAENGTHWWFDPVNWRHIEAGPIYFNENDKLPPTNRSGVGGVTDTEISIGTGAWDQGFGVVYDPTNDPNFDDVGQTIQQLYISRSPNAPSAVPANKLTIRGDLTAQGNVIIGRSSGVSGTATDGTIVQESGTFKAEQSLDLGANEEGQSGRLGYGNGTYDYRGGILEASQVGGGGLRLSNGGSGGPGGVGRFVMHNPSTPGYVRAFDVVVAGSEGGSSTFISDGEDTAVGIFEFHFENGGVRPIQVNRNMSINNGKRSASSDAIRSARLELVLHEAPEVDEFGKPENLGLFDVAFSEAGTLGGTGDLDGNTTFNDDRVFSSADGSRPFYPSSRWATAKASPNFSGFQDEDFLVTAVFGDTLYRWEAVYSGVITWEGTVGEDYGDSGVVTSISATGGVDVVLIGHSSVTLNAGLIGDYNADGAVDAADYVLWRHGGPLENEGHNEGVVDENDYDVWTANFGQADGGGSSSRVSTETVPEPGAILFLLIGTAGLVLAYRTR